jgi:hypothetical protein
MPGPEGHAYESQVRQGSKILMAQHYPAHLASSMVGHGLAAADSRVTFGCTTFATAGPSRAASS